MLVVFLYFLDKKNILVVCISKFIICEELDFNLLSYMISHHTYFYLVDHLIFFGFVQSNI